MDAYEIGIRMRANGAEIVRMLRAQAAEYERIQRAQGGLKLSQEQQFKAQERARERVRSADREDERRRQRQVRDEAKAARDKQRASERQARQDAADMRAEQRAWESARRRERQAEREKARALVEQERAEERRIRAMERAAAKAERIRAQEMRQHDAMLRAEQRTAQRMAAAQEAAARRSARAWGKAYSGINAGGLGAFHTMGAFAGVGASAYGVASIGRDIMSEGIEREQARLQIRNFRASPADVRSAEAVAENLVKTRGDGTKSAYMQMIRESAGTVGFDAALQLAPLFADFRTRLLATQKPGTNSEAALDGEFQALLKVAEGLNRVYDDKGNIDYSGIARTMALLLQSVSHSGGAINARTMATMTNYLGPLSRSMSDQAVFGYGADIAQNVGGKPGGTVVESIVAPVLKGAITKQQFLGLDGAGALDRSKVFRRRGSQLYYLKPGALKDEQMLTGAGGAEVNPYTWIRGRIKDYAERQKVSEAEATYRLMPTSAGRRGATQVLNNLIQSERSWGDRIAAATEKGTFDQKDPEWAKKSLEFQANRDRETNPGIQMTMFTAAWKDFQASLSDQVMAQSMGTLNKMTGLLRDAGTWADQNGDKVRQVGDILVGVGGTAGLLGAMRLFSGALVPFAVAGVAYTALEHLTGEKGLTALGKGLQTLSDGLKAIPESVLMAGLGAAAGARVAGPTGAVVGAGIGFGASRVPGELDEAKRERELYYQEQARSHQRDRANGIGEFGTLMRDWGIIDRSKDPPAPGVDYTPVPGSKSVDELLNDLGVNAPPGNLKKPVSYIPPANRGGSQPTEVAVYLDGEKVGSSVLGRVNREATAPPRGRTGFDGMQLPMPPGVIPI
ncbi:hypothetical protein CR162_21370, partial [Pseudoroseomonas rhizosphaerae]